MQYYTWVLTFHIISVISWMAMLFYLPRLFVYHVEHIEKEEFVSVVKIQEMKIYKYIGVPAMWASVISGITMIIMNSSLLTSGGWLHAKIFVVVLLIAYTFSLDFYRKQLLRNECKKSGKFFRAYNEVPTLFMILIVTYVITKTVSIIFTLLMIALFAFIGYKILNTKK